MSTTNTSLIVLPHAGSYVDSYSKFRPYLDKAIKFVPVEYPGHGRKFREKLLTTLDQLRDFVIEESRPHMDGDYAFYGHSMGGRIAFLVALRLRELGLPLPRHIFFSSCAAPDVKFLPPDQVDFKSIAGPTNDSPGRKPVSEKELEQLRELFYPVLRTDLEAVWNHFSPERQPVDVPLTVMYTLEDEFGETDFYRWDKETTAKVNYIQFSGDHFFNFSHAEKIGGIISSTLAVDELI